MQAAYALLMVCNQAWAMQTGAMPALQHPQKLLAQCEQGLYSLLSTLDNYALAFEAIRGMRGESKRVLVFHVRMTDGISNHRSGPRVDRGVCWSVLGRHLSLEMKPLWQNRVEGERGCN